MRIFFFFLFAETVAGMKALIVRHTGPFAWVDPEVVVGRLFSEKITSQDAVHSGVLHVDMEVRASHGNDDVEVELQFMTDAALD